MSAARILAIYRLLFSALLVVASVQTLMAADFEGPAVALLAATEIAAALLLAWRRTQWPGAWLLIGVFACAQVLSALEGEWPTRFLQYAASAMLVVTMDRALAQSGSGFKPYERQ